MRSIVVRFVLILLTGALTSLTGAWEGVEEEPVSSRPVVAARATSSHPAPVAHLISSPPALTRAEAQRRIDEMSPADWLAQFGRVSVRDRP